MLKHNQRGRRLRDSVIPYPEMPSITPMVDWFLLKATVPLCRSNTALMLSFFPVEHSVELDWQTQRASNRRPRTHKQNKITPHTYVLHLRIKTYKKKPKTQTTHKNSVARLTYQWGRESHLQKLARHTKSLCSAGTKPFLYLDDEVTHLGG